MRFLKGKYTGYRHLIGASGKNENAEKLVEYFFNGTKPLLWPDSQKKRRFRFAIPSVNIILILTILLCASLTSYFIYLINQNLFFNELSIIKIALSGLAISLLNLLASYYLTCKFRLCLSDQPVAWVRSKILCLLNLHKYTLSDDSIGIASGAHCAHCKKVLVEAVDWPRINP